MGDVVIIHSDDKPRGFWKLGCVEETLSGPDGEPRSAILLVMGKGNRLAQLRHPVQWLYPLEVTEDKARGVSSPPLKVPPATANSENDAVHGASELSGEGIPTIASRRPCRATALTAHDRQKAFVLAEGDDI